MSDLTDALAKSTPPAEMPSLERYREGNAGVPYVVSFAASRPGPHVLLTAILHGNEICGAIALDRLLQSGLRPDRGRLTFVFANIDAYRRREAGAPAPSRFLDEDMNRVWSPAYLDGGSRSVELLRARALRAVVDSADFLLDIHSMQQGNQPLLLSGPLEKGRRLALDLGFPSVVVSDAGHASGTRLRDYGAFADPSRPENSVLIECGSHDGPSSTEVAVETSLRFLALVGTVDLHSPKSRELARRTSPRLVMVTEAITAFSSRFRFTQQFSGLERIAKAGTVIAHDGERPIATPYDDCVLVMPADRCQPGQTAVRLGRVRA